MSAAGEVRALAPLWRLATGVAGGTLAALQASTCGTPALRSALLVVGLLALLLALSRRRLAPLLLAGLAIGGARGLEARANQLALAKTLTRLEAPAARVRARVVEGWTRSSWGWTARVAPLEATQRGAALALPPRCRLEVRGAVTPTALPPPGSEVAVLVGLRGAAVRPLLVASSPRLVETIAPPHGVARLRDRLARSLLDAAGTEVDAIRSAELAAALALGRHDLLPAERREGWRRSGLAHLLAVSGLHVGLVAAALWLLALVLGLRPNAARAVVLVALPAYALLAGASPSAVRAATMGVVYLAARLLGRALVPMAAVVLAATGMVLVAPALVLEVGFQLTVLVTAALVRWAPPLVRRLPGPRIVAAAVAVPLVAQLAAAPIVAATFRTVTPGALLANLAVPPLLAPTLGLCVGATLLAPLSSSAAALLLAGVGVCERALWLCGAAGRAAQLVVPALPTLTTAALVAAGWLALQAGRRARAGAVAWLAVVAATGAWWALRPAPSCPRVALLPVADGLAAVVADADATVLVDGGRYADQASSLLADGGWRRLGMVIASHRDDDHVGGIVASLDRLTVERLVLPAWMLSDPAAAPLVRAARRRGTRVVPVARGSAVASGGARLEVVWPPAIDPPAVENERSLVARLRLASGTVLVTSDISRPTEAHLAASTDLGCDVLLAPHHGSRWSCSARLLDAAQPAVALIPAGPYNRNHHPHREVLERLAARSTPFRYPARDGSCGARPVGGRWRPYP